jgi:hypothetical protein
MTTLVPFPRGLLLIASPTPDFRHCPKLSP